ncbi:MAG: hypothetical protein CBC48_06850 [bacterium TMED88]|nr:hypothetical protein [Deltaproteobacteria bacterium]OUV33358.1 MAG: hypothetical protein CBC48_06850 [bacterium TMED88]
MRPESDYESPTEQSHCQDDLSARATQPSCVFRVRNLPAELLVAAHIKKRAACADEGKRDFENIAALACDLGCNRLCESGFITIESNGKLEI